jgi:hypothetical protein
MKSKVLVLALATTAFSLTTKAQKATIGFRAGINFQNLNGKANDGSDLDFKLKTGVHIGINAEVPIAPDFYVQPGLLFSTKGAKEDVPGSSDDLKYKLSYMEVPINLLYKPVLGPGKLLLGFGPYFAYAVGGKVKYKDTDYKIKFSHDVTMQDLANYPYYIRHTDFGANFLAGYELSNRVSFQLNAQLGLTKINPKITNYPGGDKGKLKNTGFGFSIGYRLQ